MILIEKLNQHRRDLDAHLKCEFCPQEIIWIRAYDDRNFWDNVLPKIMCPECGKSTFSENGELQKIETRYADGESV